MEFVHFPFSDKEVYFYLDNTKYSSSAYIKENKKFDHLAVLEALNFLPIDYSGVFVDIGADIGNFSIYCGLFLDVQVCAIELNKEKRDNLKLNILLNRLERKVGIYPNYIGETCSTDYPRILNNNLNGLNIICMRIDRSIDAKRILYDNVTILEHHKPIIITEYESGVNYRLIHNLLYQWSYSSVHIAAENGRNFIIFINQAMLGNMGIANLQTKLNALNLKENLFGLNKNNLQRYGFSSNKLQRETLNKSIVIDDLKVTDMLARAKNKDRQLGLINRIFSDPVSAAESMLQSMSLSKDKVVIDLTNTKEVLGDYDYIYYGYDGKFLVNGQLIGDFKIPVPYNMILIRVVLHHLIEKNKKIFLLVSNVSEIKYAHEFFEQFGINYGIVLNDVPDIKWTHWSYLMNATFITSHNESLLGDFKKHYVFPARELGDIDWSLDSLLASYRVDIKQGNCKKRVLLVSYYALDMDIVGVMRSNYWFANLPKLSNGDIHIEMVTAIRPYKQYSNVHYVPDFGIESATLVTEKEFAEHLKISNHMNTVALSWTKELEKYFECIKAQYDVVLITGNPFFHFEFSKYAKRKWNAQIYQDYRDPMAVNPRLHKENQAVHQKYEDYFCSLADKVITVNQWCASHLSIMAPKPIAVIPNGYADDVFDRMAETNIRTQFKPKQNSKKMIYLSRFKGEVVASTNTVLGQCDRMVNSEIFNKARKNVKLLDSINPNKILRKAKKIITDIDGMTKNYSQNKQVIKLVYAGTFYTATNPRNLISAVKSVIGYELHHFGSESKFTKTKNARIFEYGRVPYTQVVESLQYLDIGVVYAMHDFESTTKIYDYIAADMSILVITSHENPRPKSLYKELEGLENIYWVVNDQDAITVFLQEYVHKSTQRQRRQEYSRKRSTQKLISLILDGE